MNPNIEELESLLFDWESNSLDDSGIERVREILRTDEESRTFFARQQAISAALRLESDAGFGASVSSNVTDQPNNSRSQSGKLTDDIKRVDTAPQKAVAEPGSSTEYDGIFRTGFWLAAAAVLLICALSGRLLYLELHDNSQRRNVVENENVNDDPKEATAHGVAQVTRLVDIEWAKEQTPLDVGDALAPGTLSIKSGFAQVEFFCGATVVLEGPAELDLKSTTLARVKSGRLRAQVPPAARGFSLEVDDMKVVDLGTEFGLSVSDEGTNVQVFDGEIELHQTELEKQNLIAGQAVSRAADGTLKKTEVTPERFLDIADLETRASDQRTARYQQWKIWSDNLREDPRLIAYYAFDQNDDWNRRLQSSTLPDDSELDGAIVGARRVQGRWTQKSGLEFKRPGDRVRVQIPGEYSSLTFACWVKIDSLDRLFNSLFLTDNYNLGEPHWQILDTGQMYFSVRPSKRGSGGPHDHKVLSPPFWKPSMSGKWMHLATVYNVESQSATHYLNGEVLHSETIPEEKLITTTAIGTASIGNWSMPTLPDSEFAIRNLNGSIDEFALFSAALSTDEIEEMYQNGKP